MLYCSIWYLDGVLRHERYSAVGEVRDTVHAHTASVCMLLTRWSLRMPMYIYCINYKQCNSICYNSLCSSVCSSLKQLVSNFMVLSQAGIVECSVSIHISKIDTNPKYRYSTHFVVGTTYNFYIILEILFSFVLAIYIHQNPVDRLIATCSQSRTCVPPYLTHSWGTITISSS